ncbi:MAG: hypothetical protein K9G60_01885 [Pseudolabrys sp.]|nr:hypothetical protein [Pseudolabrys sp.]
MVGDLKAERETIEKDTHLSPEGRKVKLEAVAKEQAKIVGKAMRARDAARTKLAADRDALIPGVSDKTDVAAAMRRAEIRATLSAMKGGEIEAMLIRPETPTEVLSALLEFPMRLAPLADYTPDQYRDVMDRVVATVIERDSGPAMAAIKDQSEAVELLDAAARIAMNELRSAAGTTNEALFQAWMAEAAPKDASEIAAETAALAAESAKAAALALPASARHDLISSLLAANSDALVGLPKAS